MTLTQHQKDLIIGTLLGDGNLQTESQGRNWRYRAIQKSKHKDYLFHKYEILSPLCATMPKESSVFDERTGNESQGWNFNTLTQPSLKFFADMFYTYDSNQQKWVKNVPLKIKKFLTPRALAYFYMDDGALKWLGHSNAMRICSENFSLEGNKRIQNCLLDSFEIQTNLIKKTLKNGDVSSRISIPERSSESFRKLIEPHLVECMKYKVSDGKRGHL